MLSTPKETWHPNWKGTKGVSTHVVAANFSFLTEVLFGYSREPSFIFPKCQGVLFPQFESVKLIIFAAAPLVLTPFVRNQMIHMTCAGKAGSTPIASTEMWAE